MGRATRSRRRALAACKDTRELKPGAKKLCIQVAARSAQVGESSQIAPDSSPSAVVESYTPPRRKTSPQSVLTNQLSADCRDAAAPKSRSALRHKTTAKTKKSHGRGRARRPLDDNLPRFIRLRPWRRLRFARGREIRSRSSEEASPAPIVFQRRYSVNKSGETGQHGRRKTIIKTRGRSRMADRRNRPLTITSRLPLRPRQARDLLPEARGVDPEAEQPRPVRGLYGGTYPQCEMP